MKTITFANQKGGVGKTSLMVHFAFYLAEKNKKTLVIDLDTQANASYTLSEFAQNGYASNLLTSKGLPPETLSELSKESSKIALIKADATLLEIEQSGNLDETIQIFRNHIGEFEKMGFEYVLLDTAPAMGIRLTTALGVSTDVISPIELEIYSLHGIKLMITTIRNIKARINSKLNFVGILPNRVDTRNPRQKAHMEELKAAYPQLIIPHHISLRTGIADAVASKKAVWKIPKTAAREAAREVKKVIEYTLENLSKNEEMSDVIKA
jgi:chromosome partitioning protein